jgi:hypothetical protein
MDTTRGETTAALSVVRGGDVESAAQGEGRAMSAARAHTTIAVAQPRIMQGSEKVKRLSDKQLTKIVVEGFQKIGKCLPHIYELRRRFANLPRGKANVMGCKTWSDFCIVKLNRTPDHIARLLAQYDAEFVPRPTVVPAAPATAEPTAIQAAPKWKNTIADISVGDWFSCKWNSGSAQLVRCIGFNENNAKVFSRWHCGTWTEEIGPPRAFGKAQPITPKRKVLLLSEAEARRAYPDALLEQCPQLPTEEKYPLLTGARTVADARQWLSGFLRQFEFLAVATATAEEVSSRLTPEELAILPNCKDWMEQVLSCAMAAK